MNDSVGAQTRPRQNASKTTNISKGATVTRANKSNRSWVLRTVTGMALCGLLTMVVAGCDTKTSANNKNFTHTLNTYFQTHPDCLLNDAPHFPYEATSAGKMREMDALASAKQLIRTEDRGIHITRYTLTPSGERYAPRFCYGNRKIVGIDSFTPPVKTNGFMETKVTYQYTIDNVPVWADVPQVKATFPAMAKAISGPSTGTTTLAQTMVDWQVPE